MNPNLEILNELQSISPSVAAIARVNVYRVHKSYFTEMSKELMARIAADKLYGDNKNAFTIPDGYFENLSKSVFDKIKRATQNEVAMEIDQLSPVVARIGNKNVYSLPDGYFENLSRTVFSKGQKAAPNEVAFEMNELSPLLVGIGNRNVYGLPQNYFENLQYTFEEKPVAKVVKFSMRSIAKYAAAAVVTGLLGIGIFTFVNNSVSVKPNAETAALIKQGNEIIKANTFDATLESLSDKELEKYLIQNGENIDAALAASTTDDANLPEAMDYYLDPNTLDNFLNENKLKN